MQKIQMLDVICDHFDNIAKYTHKFSADANRQLLHTTRVERRREARREFFANLLKFRQNFL